MAESLLKSYQERVQMEKNSVKYSICMDLMGRMTQLPDSQKIFGALTYLYAEYTSEKSANDFVQLIKQGKLNCTVSNMLPMGYFPLPASFLEDKIPSDVKSKLFHKEIKKRHFVTREQLLRLLNEPMKVSTAYPYISIEETKDIHASLDSLKYEIPGLDPNIYSVSNTSVVMTKKEGEKVSKEPITHFEFFFSIEQGKVQKEIEAALKDSEKNKRLFILGARASQGLNLYTISKIQFTSSAQMQLGKPKYYLNLGMMLPNQINYMSSSLEYFTSERRPYMNQYNFGEKYEGCFISFLKAGSIIALDGAVKDASLSIQSPFDPKAIVFGNSYLYPVSLKDEVRR